MNMKKKKMCIAQKNTNSTVYQQQQRNDMKSRQKQAINIFLYLCWN